MLELGQNRLASAIGALEPIACVSIFLGYVGGAFARNTFGTCECARKLSRSDGDEHEHGPYGLRRRLAVGVDQGRGPHRSSRAGHASDLPAAADRQEHAGRESARALALRSERSVLG